MKYTLAYQGGWLCVACSRSLWSEPTTVTSYWPIRRMTPDAVVEIGVPIGTPLRDCDGGLFAPDRRHGLESAQFALKDGAQTIPVHTTETPIPPPRTKLPTKYEQGRWWKLTPKGWQ